MKTTYRTFEFIALYGRCKLSWDDITSVQCTERDELVDVITYYGDKLASTFSIIFHDGQWVLHGEYDWTIDNYRAKGYYSYGVYHREDGPANVRYYDEKVHKSEWYKDGKYHRENGPAIQLYYSESGKLMAEYYLVDGKHHRKDDSACQEWHNNGTLKEEQWYINGVQHREDGPAYLYWYSSGVLHMERWYYDGKLHREGGPATIERYSEEAPLKEKWWEHGKSYEPILTKRAI